MSDKNSSPEKISRPLLYLLAKHSQWQNEDLQKVFKDKVYPNNKQLLSLFRYFILAAGVSFLVCGVIFFFAYNWDVLTNMQKFMVCEGAIVLCIIAYLFLNPAKSLAKLLLTVAMVMTGVLFAVFGQVYQTGANAYDFFLTWALAVTLWVLVSRFLTLWLIYLVVLNLVMFFYFNQVIRLRGEMYSLDAHVTLNFVALIMYELIGLKNKLLAINRWFPRIIQFTFIFFLTIAICYSIFDNTWEKDNYIALGLLVFTYALACWFYSTIVKDILPLGMMGFSLIIVMVCLMVNDSDVLDAPQILLLVCAAVLASTAGLVTLLYRLNKKWKTHGEEKTNQ